MSTSGRKRRAETLIINNEDEEPEQSQQEEQEQEEGVQTTSHDSIPELPTSIIQDILSRLPIKTLFNFHRVCKDWLSLISDPHFAKLHLSRSHVSLLLKPINRNRKRKSWKLHLVDLQIAPYTRPRNARMKLTPKINLPKDPNIAFNIPNSCNGLLCLCEPGTNDPIYVCNPILGEYVALPKCLNGTMCSDRGSAFGFSPKTTLYVLVADEIESCDRFAFVWWVRGGGDIHIGGRVMEKHWTTPYTGIENRSFNAFVNGAIHWLAFGRSSPNFICCFDFENEQFRAVPEPPEFGPCEKDCADNMRVGVLQGCLSICDFSLTYGELVTVWVMKDYGVKETWSKDLVIASMMNESNLLDYYEPVMILKSGKILMLLNEDALLLYDPELESYEDIHIYRISSKFYGIAYVPSLVLLGDIAKGENLKMCRA